MIKKTLTYDTPDGDTITEDFYFNFSKDELVDLQVLENVGIEAIGKQLAATNDGEKAWHLFKDLVLRSVGEKTADGKGFKKNQEIRENFQAKEAFGNLVFEFVNNPETGAEFFNGLVPEKWRKEIEEKAAARQPGQDATPAIAPVASQESVTKLEKKHPKDMTREELLAAYQEKNEA